MHDTCVSSDDDRIGVIVTFHNAIQVALKIVLYAMYDIERGFSHVCQDATVIIADCWVT